MKQYRVFIDITVTRTFSMKAESEEQAKEEALRMCRERSDYYARDNDGVIDVSVSDCEEDPEPEEEKTELQKAIEYVRDNMDEDDMAILKAEMNQCYKAHLIPGENVMDCEKVVDLLNEYGEENGMEERWWESECEIDEILCEL